MAVAPNPSLQEAFGKIANSDVIGGVQTLLKTGGRFIIATSVGAAGLVFKSTMEKENLSASQKIFTPLAKAALVTTGALIGISVVAGASFLTPAFIFTASVVGAVKSIADYQEARAEKNNLQKEFISTAALTEKIKKAKLEPEQEAILEKYATQPAAVYSAMYDLRKKFIATPLLNDADKKAMVEKLNEAIEKFNQGERQPKNLGIYEIEDKIVELSAKTALTSAELGQLKDAFRKFDSAISDYQDVCEQKKAFSLPKSLEKSIERYKDTREKIYSQDLPTTLKDKMARGLDAKTLHKREIADLHAQMGNHYISITPNKQLEMQDANMASTITQHFNNLDERTALEQYYKAPREIYDSFSTLQEALAQDSELDEGAKSEAFQELANLKKAYLNNPNGIDSQDARLKAVEENFPSAQASIAALKNQLNTHQANATNMQNALQGQPHLLQTLQRYQTTSLDQYARKPSMDFPSPKIKTNYRTQGKDLYEKHVGKTWVGKLMGQAEKQAKTTLAAAKKEIREKIQNKSPNSTPSFSEKKGNNPLRNDFQERFANGLDVLAKQQRLNYLTSACKKLLLGIGMQIGTAAASLGTTILIPALATPGAPAAAAATGILMTVNLGLTAASAGLGLNLLVQERKMKETIAKNKEEVTKGIVPDKALDAVIEKSAAKNQAGLSNRLKQLLEKAPTPAPLPLAQSTSSASLTKQFEVHRNPPSTPALPKASIETPPINPSTSRKSTLG